MVKFFRNIRKKLAAENKIAGYLRNAIGEIVLVVVGILIALQINNWNQIKNQRNKEVEILKAFHTQLNTDLKNLIQV